MKKHSSIVVTAAFFGAAAVFYIQYTATRPAAVGAAESNGGVAVPARAAAGDAGASSLAAQGQLWEPTAATARERARASMPVPATAFGEAQGSPVGSQVQIVLSPRFPALAAEVTGRATAADGTTVTRLRIGGEVPGTLILQDNAASRFFLGQLYYDNLAVAYEFRATDSGMAATRHELGDLICAFVTPTAHTVENIGLPPVDLARAAQAAGGKETAGATSPAEAAAAVKATAAAAATIAGTTVSVNDVSIAEGNSGTRSLQFAVTLSAADRQRVITVAYATANGTATAGSDYVAKSGTVTFPKGSTTQTVAITITGDTAVEADETFSLNLSNPVNATIADGTGVGTIVNDDSPPPPTGVPVLNSLPGATAVIYLDMDGHVDSSLMWSDATITAAGISGTYTQAQMTEIWTRVTEDYAPFQVNVTTSESAYLAAPATSRIRCVITPDNEWYGAAGGVAYVGSFTWPGDTPCWVFSDQLANTPRYIAESCSHECGHTLGLVHQGRISPAEDYYAGQGTGEVGWAPIMGVGYYKSIVQWSKGEYLSANNTEDDLAIITTQNGFTYRVDQVANTAAGATPLTRNGTAATGSGIIETRDDVDVFSFTTTGGLVTLTVLGDATSQNLDLLAEIRNAAGTLLAAANPDLLTDATVSATLPAGTYYLHVSGVGRGDYLVDGYTDYGSLGQYTISGTVP